MRHYFFKESQIWFVQNFPLVRKTLFLNVSGYYLINKKKLSQFGPRILEIWLCKFFILFVLFRPMLEAGLMQNWKTKYLQIHGTLEALRLLLCSTLDYFKMAKQEFSRIFGFRDIFFLSWDFGHFLVPQKELSPPNFYVF